MILIKPVTPLLKLLPLLRIIVVADAKTGITLSIFFDESLPDIYFELYMAAQKINESLNIEIRCQGGGFFSIIGTRLYFMEHRSILDDLKTKRCWLWPPDTRFFMTGI